MNGNQNLIVDAILGNAKRVAKIKSSKDARTQAFNYAVAECQTQRVVLDRTELVSCTCRILDGIKGV